MKKVTVCAFLSVIMILNLGITVYGGGVPGRYELSPALELICERLTMEKCVAKNSELKLSVEDFEEVLGRDVEFISVLELPEPSVGVIKYAGIELTEPITVSGKNASLLKFSPTAAEGKATFSVCVDGEVDVPVRCSVSILEKENGAPTANGMALEVYSGICHVGTFDAQDKDGDNLTFTVSETPKKGTVTVSGNGFVYTSLDGKGGNDSFEYVARDVYGNKSEPVTVKLKIKEPKSEIRYGDMAGHWGYGAAMKLTELGLMSGSLAGGGECNFHPEDEISRGDFLAMAMICAGLEEKVSVGAVSAFADDAQIPSNIRSYAAFAMSSGMVSGYSSHDGKSVFRSTDGITRAEAATMLASVLGLSEASGDLDFSDSSDIPQWSRQAFSSLCDLGIINGTPDGSLQPLATLTRAQAAQILASVA